MKKFSGHLLIIGIVGCWIFFTADSALGADVAYGQYEYDALNAPIMSLSLRSLFEGNDPYLIRLLKGEKLSPLTEDEADFVTTPEEAVMPDVQENAAQDQEPLPEEAAGNPDAGTQEEAAENSDQTIEEEISEETPSEEQPSQEEQPAEEALQEEQPQEESPQEEALQEDVYELATVDDDYFADALFIGDSRTVGLSEYCAPLMERATFYAKTSLTIYDFYKKEFVTVPVKNEETLEGEQSAEGEAPTEGEAQAEGETASEAEVPAEAETETVTIEEALTRQQFAKIYIMLGLNELGSGTTESYTQFYGTVVARIRELQPEAQIYIQGIMHVTASKSSSDKVFRNETINERNQALSTLADNKTVFYIDMNAATDDESGALIQELSFDSVHLKAKSYSLWYDYLKTHAYIKVSGEEKTE